MRYPYFTESIDLLDLSEAERDAVLRESSHEGFLERCAETAWRVLQDNGVTEVLSRETRDEMERRGHQSPIAANQVPNLLLGATAHDEYLHATASVLYHFVRHGEATRDGRIHDVSNHAMRLGYYVAQALHIEAWGRPMANLRQAGAKRAGRRKRSPQDVKARVEQLIGTGLLRKAAIISASGEFEISERCVESYLLQ